MLTLVFLCITVPTQSSIVLTSSGGNSGTQIRFVGSEVTLICRVELSSIIQSPESRCTTIQGPDGTLLAQKGPTVHVMGTTFTYTRLFESFGRNDSGNFTCTASVQPQPTLIYLTGNETFLQSISKLVCPVMVINATSTSYYSWLI